MVYLILAIVFTACGVLSVVFYLMEKVKKYSVKAVMIKTICSLFFIAVAAVGLFKNHHHVLALYVPFALFCGLLGDIWLDLKYVFREHDKAFSYAGFIMFGIGHIIFISGMFHEFYHGENILYIIIPFCIGLVFAALTILLEKPMKLKYGDMKAISATYAIALFSMSMTALSLCIMTKFQHVTLIMMFAGGVLFAVSDLILSGTYFGEGRERPVDLITNIVLYYVAQFTIALSMLFL